MTPPTFRVPSRPGKYLLPLKWDCKAVMPAVKRSREGSRGRGFEESSAPGRRALWKGRSGAAGRVAVWTVGRGFGPDPKEALKVVLEEALTATLMGTLSVLPITKLEDNLTGHLKVSLEGSPIGDLSASLKVGLKVDLTVALKVSLSVDLSAGPE